jgi:hypothetical protein
MYSSLIRHCYEDYGARSHSLLTMNPRDGGHGSTQFTQRETEVQAG